MSRTTTQTTHNANGGTYRGCVIDRMTGRVMHETRTSQTWGGAQQAAERASKRKGYTGDRYRIEVQ